MDDLNPIVIIAGPTASGKTEVALDVAEKFAGEIVNADSMQVYRELAVLTARPGAAEMARVPHHLFGVMSAAERCSAGRWLSLATDAIHGIHRRGRLPVITGGTGLYLKALTDGIAPVPDVPDETVQTVTAHLAEIGGEAFKSELAAVDPGVAGRVPAADHQRLIRAAAVFAATGKTLSDWQRLQPAGPGYAARYAIVLLLPPREELYAAINSRFDAMLEQGALDEAKTFAALGLDPSLPAPRAVGMAELLRAVNGDWPLDIAVEKAKTATRNLAKRQMTWFRRQIRADLTINEKFSQRDNEKIFSFIRQFMLTDAP